MPLAWLCGQLVLAMACTQWFAIMHECGHKTFTGHRQIDDALGHVAGAICVMPFLGWKLVHHGHHLWTGWRDRDPTTKGIVPRPIGRAERVFFNACWRYWVPVFSLAYRATIFWHVPKLGRWYPRQRLALATNAAALLAVYALAAYLLGPTLLAKLCLVALVLHFTVMDPILLGQHSHIPQHYAGGAIVKPFAKASQEVFTRSVLLPPTFSRWLLLGFDFHGLHHVHPQVPGYLLHRMPNALANTERWGAWIKAAKRVPAHVLIFQNREQSGLEI